MKSWVDISIAGRSTERHRLANNGTTTIGRAANVSLRGVEDLADEHFSLRPQPEGCWVELVETAPEPFTFDGFPSRGALVPWGQDVFYGSIRLSVQADNPLSSEKKTSPLIWVALLVLPLAGASFVYKPRAAVRHRVSPAENPPALFGAPPPCSSDADGALERANVAQQLAFSKNERGVFETQDAVTSVQLMREASACYALAGREGLSQRASEQADSWAGRLAMQYRRELLELQLALRSGDPGAIIDSALELDILLRQAGPDGEAFLEWLDEEIRVNDAKLAAKASKKKKKKG